MRLLTAAALVTWALLPARLHGQAIVNPPYSFLDLSAGNHRAGSNNNIWDVTGGDAAGTAVSVDAGHYNNGALYYLGYIVDKSNTYDVTTGSWIAATGSAGHGYLSYDPDVAQVYVTFPQAMKIGMMRFYPAGWYGFGSSSAFVTDYAVSYQDQGVWQPLIARQTVTGSQIPAGVTDSRTLFRDHTFPTVTAQSWRITLTNGEGGFTQNATFGEIQFFRALDPGNRWAPGEGGGGSGAWSSSAASWSVSAGQRGNRLQAGSGTLLFGDNPGTVTLGSAVSAAAGLTFSVDGYVVTGSHTLTLGGASPAVNAITTDAGVSTSIDAIVAGTAGLSKAGPGTLILGGTNTYTGGTVVSAGRLVGNSASLRGAITNDAALTFDQAANGTFASVIGGSGSLRKAGAGTLTLTATNVYAGGTEVVAGTLRGNVLSIQGDVVNQATLTFDQLDAGTYGGIISGGGTLTKTGVATLTMTAAQTFTGPLVIDAGALRIDGTGMLGSGNYAGSIAVAAGARLVMAGSVDQVLAGGISGSGALVKSGAGRLTLSASSTYGGATTIGAGTLALGAAGALPNTPTITVGDAASSGAVLDLTAKSGSYAFGSGQTLTGGGTVRLAPGGILAVNGTFAPGNSPGLFTYDGGVTLLAGTTTMEIHGVSRATLPSHGGDPFHDAVNVVNGGTLDFSGGVLQLAFSGLFPNHTTFALFTPQGTAQLVGNFSGVSVLGTQYAGLGWSAVGGVWRSSFTANGQSLAFDSSTGELLVTPEPHAQWLAAVAAAAGTWALQRRRKVRAG